MTQAKHTRPHTDKPHAHAKKSPPPIASDTAASRRGTAPKEDRSGYDSNVNQSSGSGTGSVNLRDEEHTTGADLNLAANNMPERSTVTKPE